MSVFKRFKNHDMLPILLILLHLSNGICSENNLQMIFKKYSKDKCFLPNGAEKMVDTGTHQLLINESGQLLN